MSKSFDLVKWTCPHCGRGWRIPSNRTSRKHCDKCIVEKHAEEDWENLFARKEAEIAKLSWFFDWLQWRVKKKELARFEADRPRWVRARMAKLWQIRRAKAVQRAAEERERLAKIQAEEERLRTEAAIEAEGIERAIREEMMSWEQRLYFEWMAQCPNERFLPVSGFERAQREKLLRRRIAETPGWHPSMGFGDPSPIVEPSPLVAGGTDLSPLEPIPPLEPEPAPAIAPAHAPVVEPPPTKPKFRFRRPKLAAKNWAEHHQPIELSGLSKMSGVEFEEWLMTLLRKLGYRKVRPTPQSGDSGGDIVAKMPDSETVICIQAKRWKSLATTKAVQEVLGGMRRYKATVGIVASWSGFTRPAEKLAKTPPRIILWGPEEIVEMVEKVRVPPPDFDGERYRTEVLQPFFRRERLRQLAFLEASRNGQPTLFHEDPFEDLPCHRHRTMPDDFEGPTEGIRAYENRVVHGVGKKRASKSKQKSGRRNKSSKRGRK